MKNEIMNINFIDKQLKVKNPINVFPLTPTHRKELRDLRNKNIGDLRNTLSNIRTLKLNEYKEKYSDDILKEFQLKKEICNTLNSNWAELIKDIQLILDKRKLFETSFIEKLEDNYSLSKGYHGLSELKLPSDINREFYIDETHVSNLIAKEEFNTQYGEAFDKVKEKIEDIHTKYEEAINFGNLELVKQLYYIMKDSEGLFTKINALKI